MTSGLPYQLTYDELVPMIGTSEKLLSHNDPPTENQISFLESLGIRPAPTHTSNQDLINYLNRARFGTKTDEYFNERVGRFIALQNEFLDKLVRNKRNKKFIGRVKFIYIHFGESRLTFRAVIENSKRHVHTQYLEVVPEE